MSFLPRGGRHGGGGGRGRGRGQDFDDAESGRGGRGFGRDGGRGFGRDGGRRGDYGRGGGGGRRGGGYEGGRRGGYHGGDRGIEREFGGMNIVEKLEIPTVAPIYKPTRILPSSKNLIPKKASKRPQFGTRGQACQVFANHFHVQLRQTTQIYHYDVSIEKTGSSLPVPTKLNWTILNQLAKDYGLSHLGGVSISFDGKKNIYTAGPLPFDESGKCFDVKIEGENDGDFKVVIKFASKKDMNLLSQFLVGKKSDCPYDTIQALDVVLRTLPTQRHVTISRSFFHSNKENHTPLGSGVECWSGFYQSLRPTQMGLSLNVDQSFTAFLEPKMVPDFVLSFLNARSIDRPFSSSDRVKIKKVLRNIKVETIHRPGFYRVRGLTDQSAAQLTFESDQGQKTVCQYFEEKYQIRLKFHFLPCIIAGREKKPAFLPLELCRIVPGQRYAKKLSENQIREMLKITCTPPANRMQCIKYMVAENDYGNDNLGREFGISVSNQLAVVKARVLPPPSLMYGGRRTEQPRFGSWNMKQQQLESGGRVDFWAFINLSNIYPDVADNFCNMLVYTCQRVGMQFAKEPIVKNVHPCRENVDVALKQLNQQILKRLTDMGSGHCHLQLLIVILPNISGYYGCIKRICETELGIVSQCCHPKKVPTANPQYCENVAMKINVKVGGRNTVVSDYLKINTVPLVNDVPTIIFGADVTHPSPGEDLSPSIAAVVASVDWPGIARYRCLVSTQAHRQEIISDLYIDSKSGMIRELLLSFYKANNRKPERIIFYRDGVSEGQFNEVLLFELESIRMACSSLESTYTPRVTFIVVQKRHHTRLFPMEQDHKGNILPGTVVDTNICHPTEFDFYLCSHAGIKGTSRPTHYHVLYDENNFTADALQTLTNNLCYTYARCTKAVSVVPSAYYAHLAALRARHYIEGADTTEGSSNVPGSSSSAVGAVIRDLPKIKKNVQEVMFFC